MEFLKLSCSNSKHARTAKFKGTGEANTYMRKNFVLITSRRADEEMAQLALRKKIILLLFKYHLKNIYIYIRFF